MNQIQKREPIKLSRDDYSVAIIKLNQDLNEGRFMNADCKTQVKNGRLIRWFKTILSKILPIKLFPSIKASKVAFSYFGFVKNHQEYLVDEQVLSNTKKVLETLNEKTHGRYSKKIDIYLYAIEGLDIDNLEDEILPENEDERINQKQVVDYLKKMSDIERIAFFKKENIKVNNVPEEFIGLIAAARKNKDLKARIEVYQKEYADASPKRKHIIAINLEEFRDKKEFSGKKTQALLDACIKTINEAVEKEKPKK